VIKCKNAVFEALSGIDVQLKNRYDLIPNILTIAKKFMEHETDLFNKITELRSKAQNSSSGSKTKFETEALLDSQLKALMVNVENYPLLKSDQQMLQAMQTYNEIEEHISAARRFYNAALTQLRNKIQIFPGSLFIGCAGEAANYSYFETDEVSKKPVNAGQYL
ncbi:MAG: LemA family protein, partial [Candidatus Gastranaerophilales bacterium]|nr:LemA family protein [Candidatus Gastranaerophilales bacterium]